VVERPVLVFRCSPTLPAIGGVEDVAVWLPLQRGFIGAILLEPVEVFQEQEPRGLFGVIQFRGATGLFPEDIVNVFEGLFKHGYLLRVR
jgi:hypothetical protein